MMQPGNSPATDHRSPHYHSDRGNNFLAFIKSIHPVSAGAEDFFYQHVNPVNLRKGEHLVKSGELCDAVYYVQKGVLRGYARQGNKEITTWITGENELVTSISGFYKQTPSFENIEALEDCTLTALHRKDLQYLYDHFPEVNIVVRLLLEKYYQDAEERAYICRLAEASFKYERFINTKTNLSNRIPLKYIASYLGMTLETLSRIRSRMSLRK